MSSHDNPGYETSSVDQIKPARTGCRLLRLPEVMSKVGLRRTAIYDRMKRGRFPKSRSLGPRCTVWLEAEIDEWIGNIAK
ncbi:AlpA family phage regulatory protein [Erythrobacter litoralis]|nr:AlpA family phage regulatory protein [Erythrobacter litoralis]